MCSVGVDGAASTGFGVLEMDRGVGGCHGASVFLCAAAAMKIALPLLARALVSEDSSLATDRHYVTIVRHPGRTDETIDGQTA